MYNEEMIKKMMELFTNPLFKKNFHEFFLKMQMEGIEAAKRFWNLKPERDTFDITPDIFEKMVDFYIILGFVPRFKYEDVLKEKENLKEENKFLRDTISELQNSLFMEGGEKVRETWKTIIDKQFETHTEISKNFFELFRNLSGGQQAKAS